MDPPRLDHSRVAGFPAPVPAAADPAAVQRIAAALAAAQAPVLVTSRVGRTEAGFTAVTALADLAGLPVTGRLDTGTVNISSTHPASLPNQAAAAAAVSAADVILVVESDVPWLPAMVTLRDDAQVFHVDPDPAKVSMPLWSYPVDLAVQADGAAGLAAITAALAEIAGGQPEVAKRLAGRVAAQRERSAARPGPAPVENPLSPRGVMSALNQVIDAEDVVIEEAVTNASAVYEGLERTRPCTLTGPGGPGLGWALGGALGVKLARPDRRVITVTGDGSFLFGVPTSALMMAAEWGTPFLAVILNNKGYRASRLPVYGLFPEGASARRKTAVGTRFTWAPDYPALAAACHAHGERVERAEDLVPALRRALEAVDAGRAAVVECVTEQD
jgi:acetolactate synthase-1/2/3 large subunit